MTGQDIKDKLLNQNNNHQEKTWLRQESVDLLDAALNSGEADIPTLGMILRNAKHQELSSAQRRQRSFIQISFVVTTTDGRMLIIHRDSRPKDRLLQENANERYANLKKGSNLVSYSPMAVPTPGTFADLVHGLYQKIPPSALLNNPVRDVNFLGIAKNTRTDEHTGETLISYYFYIFELNLELRDPDGFKKGIETDGVKDLDDFKDLAFFYIDKLIFDVTASNFLAERAATLLLLRHRGYPEELLQNLQAGKKVAPYRPADNANPFDASAGSLFVSHARLNYDSHRIRDFVETLRRFGKKCWVQHTDAQQAEPWEVANKALIPICKNFICFETPEARRKKTVLEEIDLAMRTNLKYPDYRVFRFRSGDFYSSPDEKDEKKKFTEEDFRRELIAVTGDEMLVNKYLGLSVIVKEIHELEKPDIWQEVIETLKL